MEDRSLRALEDGLTEPGWQVAEALEVLPGGTGVIVDLCGAGQFATGGPERLFVLSNDRCSWP